MDVVEIIKSEHQRIRNLFDMIKSESGKQQRKLLFDNIRHDLQLHFHAEQTVLFPAFRNYEEFQAITDECHKDQRAMVELVTKLVKADPGSVDFENGLVQLLNFVDNHISRIEGEYYTLLRQVMRRPERERLGRLFQAAEQEREEAA